MSPGFAPRLKIARTAMCRDGLAAIVVLLLSLVACAFPARGEDVVSLTVKGRVQLELPGSWTITDASHRRRVADLAGDMMGKAPTHVAALAAQSHPMPSRVFVRVSFVAMSLPLTQADLKREVARDRAGALRVLAAEWEAEAATMWAAMAQYGVREVGRPVFDVEAVGGQTALVIRYARTSPGNQAQTMRVAQYHVPMGAEKVLVTLTHAAGDASAIAAHDRVRTSLRIR